MHRRDSDFDRLQAFWYQRLKETGFEDIENTNLPDRPLKQWHSTEFAKPVVRNRSKTRLEYQEKAQAFFHRKDIEDVWRSIVSHGSTTLKVCHVKKIWELYLDGLTERTIASQMNRSKTCIHYTLVKIKAWMNLI